MLDIDVLTIHLREGLGFTDLRLLAHRPESAVFSAVRRSAPVIAKCSETVRRTAQEEEVLRLLEPSGLSVPRVLELIDSAMPGPPEGRRSLGVLVMSLLPGQRLDEVLPNLPLTAAVQVWRDAGRALGLLQRAISAPRLQSAAFWQHTSTRRVRRSRGAGRPPNACGAGSRTPARQPTS